MNGRSVAALRAHLAEMANIPDAAWMASLDERKRKELEFHDRTRDRCQQQSLDRDTFERLYGNAKYYDATGASKRYVDEWLRKHVPGKVFLDYACGNGAKAIKAAKFGAALSIGLDVSSTSLANARADAAQEGVSDRVIFVQADCENTKLPSGSIDCILCSGMLHHLDLSYAFPELRRILASGGKILALEALDYNPLIKLYRKLTPAMRTEWEKAHILSLKDLCYARRFFDVGEVRYWHITSIATPHFPALASSFEAIDRALTRLPLVRLMAWIFTFELKKPQAALR